MTQSKRAARRNCNRVLVLPTETC